MSTLEAFVDEAVREAPEAVRKIVEEGRMGYKESLLQAVVRKADGQVKPSAVRQRCPDRLRYPRRVGT